MIFKVAKSKPTPLEKGLLVGLLKTDTSPDTRKPKGVGLLTIFLVTAVLASLLYAAKILYSTYWK